jgi:hypothetical protein
MEAIWTNPKIAGGYTAVKQYEDEFLYISRGSLNQYTHAKEMGNPRLVLIHFNLLEATLIGDDAQDIELLALLETNNASLPDRLHKWAFTLLVTHLEPQWFKYLLDKAYTKGVRVGRNDLRKQLNNLLREE